MKTLVASIDYRSNIDSLVKDVSMWLLKKEKTISIQYGTNIEIWSSLTPLLSTPEKWSCHNVKMF